VTTLDLASHRAGGSAPSPIAPIALQRFPRFAANASTVCAASMASPRSAMSPPLSLHP
jgi:hypothetical protein